MRSAPCLQLQAPIGARIEFLLDNYAHFVSDIDALCKRLQALSEPSGRDTVLAWQAEARAGRVAGVVRALLERHCDPVYAKSMQRQFTGLAAAPPLAMADASPMALVAASE